MEGSHSWELALSDPEGRHKPSIEFSQGGLEIRADVARWGGGAKREQPPLGSGEHPTATAKPAAGHRNDPASSPKSIQLVVDGTSPTLGADVDNRQGNAPGEAAAEVPESMLSLAQEPRSPNPAAGGAEEWELLRGWERLRSGQHYKEFQVL